MRPGEGVVSNTGAKWDPWKALERQNPVTVFTASPEIVWIIEPLPRRGTRPDDCRKTFLSATVHVYMI